MDLNPSQELLDFLVEDRVKKTLDVLVTSHRNGTITPQEALSGIATISALRLLPGDFERRLKSLN